MGGEYTIRRAKPADRDALTALCLKSKQSNGYSDAFMAACVDELTIRDHWITDQDFWVAESGAGTLAGCIRLALCEGNSEGELVTCFVDPAAKGRGVGRQLFTAFLGRAREHGLKRLIVDADPEAEAFYQHLGFTTIGWSPSGSIPGRMLPHLEMILTDRQTEQTR